MVHLVYCDNAGKQGDRVLDRILAGRKTMVARSAAGRKIPHSRVFPGESLYFMEKGSLKVSAQAVATNVENYVKLSEDEINQLFDKNADKLALTDKQRDRWHKKCVCLVEFDQVQPIDPPLAFEKQNNMDDWLIIDKIQDVLEGTSVPYNYENSKL